MALRPIIHFPDRRLREKAKPIAKVTSEVRRLLDDMAETMYAAPGIGLAAPQVGELLRAIVVDVGDQQQKKLFKLLNPEIVASAGYTDSEEGCLSIPGVRETIKRHSNITVRALDEHSKELNIEATGLLAICLQHEIDHLNGVLFIDHLSKLKKRLLKSKLDRLQQEFASK